MVVDLANDPLLARLAPMSAKGKKERGYEELVTRFFAYGDGLETYRDRPSDFLFAYSKKMNEAFAANPELAETYRQRFSAVLDFVSRNFSFGFRKTATGSATPRTRFESIAIGTDRALAEQPELADRSVDEINVASWIDLPEFQKITGSDGANAVARLRGRIEFVKDKLVRHGNN